MPCLSDALGDRYRVERQLDEGVMATGYLAYDLKHDRPVALKVLRPELAADLDAALPGRDPHHRRASSRRGRAEPEPVEVNPDPA